MNFTDFFWQHPTLSSYIRRVSEGEYLFHQGDEASEMFILISGLAQLIAVRGEREYPIEFLTPGQFLGERVVIHSIPYRRQFSVKAKSEISVVELSADAVEAIEAADPKLMIDLLKGIFAVASDRLFRANRLVQVLRSSDNKHRFVHLLLYFIETSGRDVPGGKEVFLPMERIRFYLDIPAMEAETALRHLEGRKLLTRSADDFYIFSSETALAGEIAALAKDAISLPVL